MTRLAFRFSLLAALLSCLYARSQSVDYDYYPYAQPEQFSVPEPDSSLFFAPASTNDIYTGICRYHSHPVRFRPRGLSDKDDITTVEWLKMDDAIYHSTPYALLSGLYACTAQNQTEPDIANNIVAQSGSANVYHATIPLSIRNRTRFTIKGSDRNYRIAASAGTGRVSRNGKWETAFSAGIKYGPDAHVTGVFTDEAHYSILVSRNFASTRISLFSVGSASRKGMRLAAVREIQELTGNNLYNPAWGYQNGKVRNSRVRSSFMPLTVLSVSSSLSPKHTIHASAGFLFGHTGQTALCWFDASSPMPDYYRRLPSGIGREDIAATVAEQFRAVNTDYTQIDWKELYFQNIYGPEYGHYILEERIERQGRVHLDAGAVFKSGNLTVSYGIQALVGTVNRYKTAADMLGSQQIPNINQYQTEDIAFGKHIRNDIRQTDYRTYKGDRFGYDYSIRQHRISAYGLAEYRSSRVSVSFGAEIYNESVMRQGKYENELFPDRKSFGDSKRIVHTAFSLDMNARYSFGPLHSIFLKLLARKTPPDFDDIFIDPRINNIFHSQTEMSSDNQIRLGYELDMAARTKASISFFARTNNRRKETIRYYDDLSAEFSDAAITFGLLLYCGIEAALAMDITRHLTLEIAARWGHAAYRSGATATIYSDADAALVAEDISCQITGTHPGNFPEASCLGNLTYRNRGWTARLSAGYYAKRFMEINPLYFTSRITGLDVAPETAAKFRTQHSLPPAATVNATIGKTFFLHEKGYISVTVTLNNILCDRNIIYSAYPQMRILKTGSGINRSYAPAAAKYLYSYPAGGSLTVSYSF